MDPASRQTREDMIRELIAARAYEMWENQGRSHGRDRLHWLQAEQEIMSSLPHDGAPSAGINGSVTQGSPDVPAKPAQRTRRRASGKVRHGK
ncbi:MAG: hypothetical protein B7Z80_00800 [Rhodospirillales bacterium 20-64-7]|nr:MAG: hypothetical protein B7Z80_00800 [Rhodospirillales bacterium 20-64-7]